jgi:signal transduction histidine kinase
MLAVAIGILSFLIIVLVAYTGFLQLQIRSINRQLTKRLTEKTRQPVNLELFNRELNALAININKSLKVEEQLRLDGFREERRYKEMIANISHDLRTPLTAIKGYAQLLEKSELSDDQRQKLNIAQKHADELGSLIEHFFEYSYLVNAARKPDLQRINLTNLTAECLAESVGSLEEKNLSVKFEDAVPVFAMADREMTTRIIQNLIRNCVAYSAGEITVRLSCAENAVISFANPVLDASDIDINQLFDRFYTADKARRKSTGLGLSIVRLLAEQMGGRVSAGLKDNIIDIQVELPL